MGGSRTGLSTSSAGLESNSAFKNSFSSSRKCFELLITPEFVHAATKAVLLSSGIGWSFSSSKLHASLFHTCSGWYTFQFLLTAIWLLGTNLLFPLHYGVLRFSKLDLIAFFADGVSAANHVLLYSISFSLCPFLRLRELKLTLFCGYLNLQVMLILFCVLLCKTPLTCWLQSCPCNSAADSLCANQSDHFKPRTSLCVCTLIVLN